MNDDWIVYVLRNVFVSFFPFARWPVHLSLLVLLTAREHHIWISYKRLSTHGFGEGANENRS